MWIEDEAKTREKREQQQKISTQSKRERRETTNTLYTSKLTNNKYNIINTNNK
jgi:hypothetical protein